MNKVWTGRFGLILHKVTSPIVLGIVFFVVVTPIGFLMRLLGKDPLRLRRNAAAKSYWIRPRAAGAGARVADNQF